MPLKGQDNEQQERRNNQGSAPLGTWVVVRRSLLKRACHEILLWCRVVRLQTIAHQSVHVKSRSSPAAVLFESVRQERFDQFFGVEQFLTRRVQFDLALVEQVAVVRKLQHAPHVLLDDHERNVLPLVELL